MCEGYNDGEADFSGLEDEFLCEYVDGTMDPVVRQVFEEYLRMNPDLRQHIECLRSTRLLLCRYGCHCHAPRDLHDRLRRQISCEMMNARIPFHLMLSDRLRSFATVTSAMALVFMVGMLAGVSITEDDLAAVPSITKSEVEGAQGGFRSGFGSSAGFFTNSKPYYPSLSSFAPFSSLRSLTSSDSHAEWQRIDTSVASMAGTRLAP